jgi:FkbM family methyltransferase
MAAALAFSRQHVIVLAVVLFLLLLSRIPTPTTCEPRSPVYTGSAATSADPMRAHAEVQLPLWALMDESARPPPHRRARDLGGNSTHPPAGVSASFDNEDWFAYRNYFCGLHRGVVLEMGAVDGEHKSNTHFFEKSLDWYPIHVEVSHRNFAKLRQKRPGCLNLQVAGCAVPQLVHMVDEPDGITSVSGIVEFMTPAFRQRWWPRFVEESSWKDLPPVPCWPLNRVLGRFGITHIDLFILDVEGAELEVLRPLNFTMLTVDVICVEADGLNPTKDAGVRSLLEAAGYKFLTIWPAGMNMWFARKDFVPSAC